MRPAGRTGVTPYPVSTRAPDPAGSLPWVAPRAGLARPRRHDSNVRRPPSEGGALSTELRRATWCDGASTAGVDPAPSGFVDRCPLHWVTSTGAPPTGLEPVAFCSTGSCSDRLSYGGVYACAPCSPLKHAGRASDPSRSSSDACSEARGLEPSLLRGKSPVPYLSGVTRIVVRGSERNRTPCVGKTAGLPPAAPHGATDPCGAIAKWPRRRCSAVVKMLVSGLVIRRV